MIVIHRIHQKEHSLGLPWRSRGSRRSTGPTLQGANLPLYLLQLQLYLMQLHVLLHVVLLLLPQLLQHLLQLHVLLHVVLLLLRHVLLQPCLLQLLLQLSNPAVQMPCVLMKELLELQHHMLCVQSMLVRTCCQHQCCSGHC